MTDPGRHGQGAEHGQADAPELDGQLPLWPALVGQEHAPDAPA